MQRKISKNRISLLLLAALLAVLCPVLSKSVRAEEGTQAPGSEARETFAPGFEASLVKTYQNKPVSAESLRDRVAYEGELTLSYLREPDWSKPGYTDAVLLLQNGAGQTYAQAFTVLIERDTEPPTLMGVHAIDAYLDEGIFYMDDVSAYDNADDEPVITVDTSKVNSHAAGKYTVVYTATDYSGNSVSKKAEVTLMEPMYTQEEVHELAAGVLAQITRPGMTVTEKLRAIFLWCRGTIQYSHGVGHKDWRRAAVQGFTKGAGDCYSFYACARAMLDEIGVNYLSVERVGGETHHYWMLVNVGTGWYHFDPTIQTHHKSECFMWTDEQCQVKPAFWRYDHDLFPEVAHEPFDFEAQVERERLAMGTDAP